MKRSDDKRGGGSVTIFDVAEEAGVSYSTVSRVVNGHPHIATVTKERVEDVMRKLGYVANLRARSLAGGRSQVIGLLVCDLESSFLIEVARGIDQEVSRLDYDMMLCTTRQRRGREANYVAQLSVGAVDGLVIVLPAKLEEYVDKLHAQRFPTVLIDYDGLTANHTVNATNEQGARDATQHLIDLGHTGIGFITGALHTASARHRRDGFEKTMKGAGLVIDPDLVVEGDYLEPSGYAGAHRILANPAPPTAIMTSSDTEAFGVLRAAEERGLLVPDDLSVVGFDDIPGAGYAQPRLTTVRQPMTEMGALAARILLELINDPAIAERHEELPTELVVRGSTAAPR